MKQKMFEIDAPDEDLLLSWEDDSSSVNTNGPLEFSRASSPARSSPSLQSNQPITRVVHPEVLKDLDPQVSHGTTPSLSRDASVCAEPPLVDTSGGRNQKRKFPGPAGVLPSKSPTAVLLLQSLNQSPLTTSSPSVAVQEAEIGLSQGPLDLPTTTVPWKALMEDLGPSADTILEKFSIKSMLLKASRKMLPKGKVPLLVGVVEQLGAHGTDASVVLKDGSGRMNGSLHRDLIKDPLTAVQVGMVLVLRQVSVISPSRRTHYLNITPSNVVLTYSGSDRVHRRQGTQLSGESPLYEGPDPQPGILKKIVSDSECELLASVRREDSRLSRTSGSRFFSLGSPKCAANTPRGPQILFQTSSTNRPVFSPSPGSSTSWQARPFNSPSSVGQKLDHPSFGTSLGIGAGGAARRLQGLGHTTTHTSSNSFPFTVNGLASGNISQAASESFRTFLPEEDFLNDDDSEFLEMCSSLPDSENFLNNVLDKSDEPFNSVQSSISNSSLFSAPKKFSFKLPSNSPKTLPPEKQHESGPGLHKTNINSSSNFHTKVNSSSNSHINRNAPSNFHANKNSLSNSLSNKTNVNFSSNSLSNKTNMNFSSNFLSNNTNVNVSSNCLSNKPNVNSHKKPSMSERNSALRELEEQSVDLFPPNVGGQSPQVTAAPSTLDRDPRVQLGHHTDGGGGGGGISGGNSLWDDGLTDDLLLSQDF